MTIPTNEITTAITAPMTTTDFWYGIALALGFRKQVRSLIEGAAGLGSDAKLRVLGGSTGTDDDQ